MNASELHRKLIYCGYTDISAYLNDNPVNRYLYKQLIEVRQREAISVPILKLFNEVYYQCVKVQTDSHPGEEVKKRYLRDAEDWLGSKKAALMVVSIVWALLQRKYKMSFNDECFIDQITQSVKQGSYIVMANDLVSFMQSGDIYSPQEFKTMPIKAGELPIGNSAEGDETWRTVTENFTAPVIERLLTLYSNRSDQADLLNCIVGGMSYEEKQAHSEFIHRLREGINAGNYLPHGNYFDNIDNEEESPTVEEIVAYQTAGEDPVPDKDYMFTSGLSQFLDKVFDDRTEQYKQERDTYKYRFEEERKAHAADVARIDANYKAEIASLKALLDQQPQQETPAKKIEGKTEPSFTIAEMVALVKERFSKSGANEVSAMFYSLAAEHQYLNGDVLKLINGIVPAVLQRDRQNQYFEMPNVQQFNNNPTNVINSQK